MKNSFYKMLFLSMFINIDIDKSKSKKVPSIYVDRHNKNFLKGIKS